MTIKHYRILFEYNIWAYDRMMERAAELNETEYKAPMGLNHGNGSILGTLVHAIGTEQAWLERCQGRDIAAFLTEEQVLSILMLRVRSEEMASNWRSFLSSLVDTDLDEPVTNTSPRSGRRFTSPLWTRLTHALNHAAQHRSEVALALTKLGRSPGDLDFLTYYTNTSFSAR